MLVSMRSSEFKEDACTSYVSMNQCSLLWVLAVPEESAQVASDQLRTAALCFKKTI